jgi:hypothetical protein
MALGAELNNAGGERIALAVLGSYNMAVVAAGTSQSTATLLSACTNVITSGTGGVRLPVCGTNDRIHVANYLTVNAMVYPPTAGKLNNNTANVGAVLAPRSAADFVSVDGTSFTALMGN